MTVLFLIASAENAAAQSIPDGFLGYHDWDEVSAEEAARRGVPRYASPGYDPNWEREVFSFSTNEAGLTTYSVTRVPGDLGAALAVARRKLAYRRWQAEVGGMVWNAHAVPTDDRTQGKLTSANMKAESNPDYVIPNWKFGDGVYQRLDRATVIALGDALTAHVQACFDREAAIDAALALAGDAYAVRDTLAAEIDKGWPASAIAQS